MGEGQRLLEPMGLGSLVRGDQALLQAEPEELMCALGHSSLGDSLCFLVLLRRLAGGPWLLNAGNKSRDVKIKHKAAVLPLRCSPLLLSWLQLAVLGHFLLRLSYAGSLCPRSEKLG